MVQTTSNHYKALNIRGSTDAPLSSFSEAFHFIFFKTNLKDKKQKKNRSKALKHFLAYLKVPF